MSAPENLYLPEWPEALACVNADQAPTLSELRGQVVLLFFWNGSLVHARALLAELKAIEARFPEGLALIGIHVPRYPAEVEDALVLKHINRSYLRHPVLNDRQHRWYRALGLPGLPASVLLDARGRIHGIYPGEGRGNELELAIDTLIHEARTARILVETPSGSAPRRAEPKASLSFPCGLAAGEQRLYVADSGRNRVLECTFDGVVTRRFGCGNAGLWDGVAHECGMQLPQALCVAGDRLYVADTGNQVIRKVHLISGQVETLIGNGQLGREPRPHLCEARELPLSFPLGLVAAQDRLYAAISGMHQIWSFGLGLNRAQFGVPSGSGKAGMDDGYADQASFCEPQALTASRDTVYVLDSGSGALRALRLADGIVSTLLAGELHEPGDADGPSGTARMQYPRAMAFDAQRNVLWIADSYNGKLKVYSIVKRELKTLALNYRFSNPGGLAIGGSALFIADTDAHELLRLDLKTGRMARLNLTDAA
ncbi:MAG: hypothetical protein MUE46_07810 [Xanthomonadales bacterium]|nr:hypothetical protein [Xanthomonadales bacterium]